MNKEELDKFIKQLIESIYKTDVYNDAAPKNVKFPYIVYDSSTLNSLYYPRIDGLLTINVWDKSSNYDSVNKITDIIQKGIDRKSSHNDNVIGSFYLNTRNNVADADNSLKRCALVLSINLYFK